MRGFGALSIAGGGLVAGWLAVAPPPAPSVRAITPPSRDAGASGLTQLEALANAQRQAAGPLHPATRNPFKFAAPRPPAPDVAASALEPPPDAPVSGPVRQELSLSGIAQDETAEGIHRTAIIVGDGGLFLAAEGEMAGRYRVVRIDAAAVELRDEGAGTTLELRLPY